MSTVSQAINGVRTAQDFEAVSLMVLAQIEAGHEDAPALMAHLAYKGHALILNSTNLPDAHHVSGAVTRLLSV